MSWINPNNPRQRLEHVSEMVDPDNPQRDGEVVPRDPNLTVMENKVRYMRRHPMYLPPNPWPEAMLLYGINAKDCVCCAFIMKLEQFETVPHDVLFGLCDSATERLYFAPLITMPSSNEEGCEYIDGWLENAEADPERFQREHLYLDVNRWWVDKHERQVL